MGRLRISYFDVVGEALAGEALDERRVGNAIERLSRTYREGRHDFDYRTPWGRAAYLWHLLPAHVCDLTRLLEDLPELFADRRELRVAAVGAGPGSEVLALLETISAARERGQLLQLAHIEVTRLDHCRHWDQAFEAVHPVARRRAAERAPDLGSAWQLEAPAQALAWDLRDGVPASGEVREVLAAADLVTMANVVSEVAPRGTPELPAGFADTVVELCAALRPGAAILIADRAGAPGVRARLEHFLQLAGGQLAGGERNVVAFGPRERETRCACSITREVKRIYRHVRLPTTRAEDRPVRNCKTVWCMLRIDPAEEEV